MAREDERGGTRQDKRRENREKRREKTRREKKQDKRRDKMKKREKKKEKRRDKMKKKREDERAISATCFEKKSFSDELLLHFSSKVQNLTVFSIIYIRIRFFGPGDLIQKLFRAAQYSIFELNQNRRSCERLNVDILCLLRFHFASPYRAS